MQHQHTHGRKSSPPKKIVSDSFSVLTLSHNCLLSLLETLQDQQVDLTQDPFTVSALSPGVCEIGMCPSIVEFLFPTVLQVS